MRWIRLVLPAQSALPMKQKRNIHINECVRRLRNCSPEMEWEEKREFLQDYVVRLYHAGYTEQFRCDIIRQSLARYAGMIRADRDGQHPLYRERDWQTANRRQQKQKKKTSWLSKGGYDTIIMVNPTPGGELARQLQKVFCENPGPVKIKIQEQRVCRSATNFRGPIQTDAAVISHCMRTWRGKGEEYRRNNLVYFLC